MFAILYHMKIHFVCTGNMYRSRLGEAYLKSKELPGVDVTSSGILADIEYEFDGPIAWSAMRLIFKHSLTRFMSITPTKTTLDLLNNADLVIFMKGNHHEFSKKELGWLGTNYEIWEVADMDTETGFETIEDYADINKVIPESDKTFDIIREKVNELVERLQL